MASVTLTNIRKIYDPNVVALDDINLNIEHGEFFVLVGPSGCGKSTLLRMIAGLEEISEGEIKIGDMRINEIPPKDRDVAMVFQNYALYPHMTVFENMSFALRHRKTPKKEIVERVEAAAKMLELTEYLHRKPRALSGGQRQRVAVGRAMVRDPNVFLFDEPLSNLDAKLRLQMRVEISRLHKQLGATMIYVTHDQVEAMTMGTRIVVLKDGRIQQVDTPSKLYQNPNNRFVAGFIGSPAMNFLEGISEDITDGYLIIDEHQVRVKPDLLARAHESAGGRAVLGIRPEHTYDADKSPDLPVSTPIPVVIEMVEPIGSDTYIYFSIGNTECCMRVSGSQDYATGNKISVCFDADKMAFFHPETGERL